MGKPSAGGEAFVEQILFIDTLAQQAGDVARAAGLPVSIMIAHACLESDYGRNGRAKAFNTIFGITKLGPHPDCTTIDSISPVDGAGQRKVSQPFCIADDYAHAARIWVDYLLNHPDSTRSAALRGAAGDPAKIARLLPERFAFGPAHATAEEKQKYASDLMWIVGHFGLTKYDAP
jgi:hypothetical protein